VPTVNTATGALDVSALGPTLMHEHVFTFHSDIFGDYPWTDEQVFADSAVNKLKRLKRAGISTIVDLTVFGLGRNVARVARIAERAGFTIVVATGLYTLNELPSYFRAQLAARGAAYLEDLFVREITEGIGNTGIRAAVLKGCTDQPGLTPDVETVLRAVARAHRRTGAPILTHSNARFRTGLTQQQVFREEGVDLERVVLGHSDTTDDLDHLEKLIAAGSYLGLDQFGDSRDPVRVKTVAALCRRGYAARLVLSSDARCGGDIEPARALREWRYGIVPTQIIPALRAAGVPADDLDLMLVRNPRAIFGAPHRAAAGTR
jgi:phosphotriesterase-related protein